MTSRHQSQPAAGRATTDWTAVLDELEQALETGAATTEWVPPADLPPMPGHLLERAEALLERQRALALELAIERDRVGEELDGQRRAARSTGPAPATGSALSL